MKKANVERQIATIDFEEWLRIQAVVNAARKWAAFEEADSLADQHTDMRLRMEAIDARTALLAAIKAVDI